MCFFPNENSIYLTIALIKGYLSHMSLFSVCKLNNLVRESQTECQWLIEFGWAIDT